LRFEQRPWSGALVVLNGPHVIAGLDPAIHEAEQEMKGLRTDFLDIHDGLPGQARQ
jgi:hypothetical protein